jgi:hypothetical protein
MAEADESGSDTQRKFSFGGDPLISKLISVLMGIQRSKDAGFEFWETPLGDPLPNCCSRPLNASSARSLPSPSSRKALV